MTNNFNSINCPACQKEMQQIFIPRLNMNIDICIDGCGGIYFDNRELKHFDTQNEDITEIIEALKNKTFIKVDETSSRICPVCGTKMIKNHSSVKQTIVIDECYNCGGKFLDEGELEKIRNEYHSENEKNIDTTAYIQSIIGKVENLTETFNYTSKRQSGLKNIFDALMRIN